MEATCLSIAWCGVRNTLLDVLNCVLWINDRPQSAGGWGRWGGTADLHDLFLVFPLKASSLGSCALKKNRKNPRCYSSLMLHLQTGSAGVKQDKMAGVMQFIVKMDYSVALCSIFLMKFRFWEPIRGSAVEIHSNHCCFYLQPNEVEHLQTVCSSSLSLLSQISVISHDHSRLESLH